VGSAEILGAEIIDPSFCFDGQRHERFPRVDKSTEVSGVSSALGRLWDLDGVVEN
jgi:hypothetical protein